MTSVAELVVEYSWKAVVLSAPKKYFNAESVGFCAGRPVARSDGGLLWWPEGAEKKSKPIAIEGLKRLMVYQAKGRQMVGLEDRIGPVAVNLKPDGSFDYISLHPAGYEKSNAICCGEGRQAGSGHLKNDRENLHALCWMGSPESVVALHAPDGASRARRWNENRTCGSKQRRQSLVRRPSFNFRVQQTLEPL